MKAYLDTAADLVLICLAVGVATWYAQKAWRWLVRQKYGE
jgi:hypothetical protein